MKKASFRFLSLTALSLLMAACGDRKPREEMNLGEQMDFTITGMEPGSGIAETSRKALAAYDNLEGWEIHESSTAGMLIALDQATKRKEPVIITGWAPHFIFETYDIKFLEDPKNVLGDAEDIHTMARLGLKEDKPEAYAFLENFNWTVEDMQAVMVDAIDVEFEEASETWIEENRDMVESWTEGIDHVDGESFNLVSFPWDTERASSHVVEAVLEELGYKVTTTNVDPAIMFKALAAGETDATVAVWLPTTQAPLIKEYAGQLDDLGVNLHGTQVGYIVPAYMDIDSIEDLPAYVEE
ncbi:glycine betaine ABC transporter substrate-binding protein [Marinilactibacillus sp. Marseille-P9653]|uniref:glycine betaine ABC transporter substrate-binding protein n=1 Tax=Marinilactibacillus sp. Marseille-P9653 TaxID=2866583 RepID=UPI001CE49A5A|nr:glycine betaine ABC transporter substrate-binding protein [Marinilactibacillus sp. Marseille-P9653]